MLGELTWGEKVGLALLVGETAVYKICDGIIHL